MSKHRNLANPELARAMQELRRSSAAQRHELKSRKGSRADRKRAALREQ